MKNEKTYMGFAVGKEITSFEEGSWQEAEHMRGGRKFFESPPAAERTVPVSEQQLSDSHVGETALAAVEATQVRSPSPSTEL
ncbi:MAG: hypothetical protein JWO35_426 [Candidatus Saccharibacteria bacterium]|nr:hypothetical protein [Candidatus Saccharibacteria bacterium]